MALLSHVDLRLLDDMTTDLATLDANPLSNKLIHADVTIQGIEDVSKDDRRIPRKVNRNSQAAQTQLDAGFVKKAKEMRTHWEECIGRDMHLPDGYSHVAVLLIKWADELDELKTAEEVSNYSTAFGQVQSAAIADGHARAKLVTTDSRA